MRAPNAQMPAAVLQTSAGQNARRVMRPMQSSMVEFLVLEPGLKISSLKQPASLACLTGPIRSRLRLGLACGQLAAA